MPHHYAVWLQLPLLQLLSHTLHAATAAAALLVLVVAPAPVALLPTTVAPTTAAVQYHHCLATLAAAALPSLQPQPYVMRIFRVGNGGGKLGNGSDIASSRWWRMNFEE
ncbi:hypothetical protein DFH07DRAFT_768794 [Mycena maculata]|uniref:Secreted protein n=1 Tax=Mycena maculata TaxID=230809 RepID=A0AAD7JRC0_9AGAR|nr:hypothetical protein DFH07DRAFT_768794 [Mycena maculata]